MSFKSLSVERITRPVNILDFVCALEATANVIGLRSVSLVGASSSEMLGSSKLMFSVVFANNIEISVVVDASDMESAPWEVNIFGSHMSRGSWLLIATTAGVIGQLTKGVVGWWSSFAGGSSAETIDPDALLDLIRSCGSSDFDECAARFAAHTQLEQV